MRRIKVWYGRFPTRGWFMLSGPVMFVIAIAVGPAMVKGDPPRTTGGDRSSTVPDKPATNDDVRPLDPPTLNLVPSAGSAEPAEPAEAKVDPDRELDSIDAALRGRVIDRPAAGLFGDVLEIIRRRGSVLDGSVLDPDAAGSPGTASPPIVAASPADDSATPVAGAPTEADYRAAEALLRAARMLSQTAGGNGRRIKLVKQMRAEAVNLISAP